MNTLLKRGFSKNITVLIAVAIGAVLFLVPTPAFAGDAPNLVNYQALATDSGGTNINDALHDFRFTIMDAATAGNVVGGGPYTSTDVTVTNGLLNIQVALPGSDFTGSGTNEYYLKVEVGDGVSGADSTWEELTPRQRIVSVPYALEAKKVDGTAIIADGTAANPSIGWKSDDDGSGTGFWRHEPDRIGVTINGTNQWLFLSTDIQGQTSGSPRLSNINSTATTPNIITDASDPDTGVGAAGADQLSLIAGGVEMMRLAEGATDDVSFMAGSVGIGTTGPTDVFHVLTSSSDTSIARFESTAANGGAGISLENDAQIWTLRIDGSDGDKFQIEDAGGQRLTIDTSGNVGIGTTTPDEVLTVQSGATPSDVFVVDMLGTTGRVRIRENAAGHPLLYLDKSGSQVIGLDASGATSFYDTGGDFNFDSNTLYVDASENKVGIGTTAPGSKLEIKSNTYEDFIILDRTGITEIDQKIFLTPAFTTSGETQFRIHIGSSGEQFVVEESGNVGIGTTTPAEKLDLRDGNLAISDADVAHGFTSNVATNIFGHFVPIHDTDGGMRIRGLSDTDAKALSLAGFIGSTNPTDTTPAVLIEGAKSNGAGWISALGATETVLGVDVDVDGASEFVILGSGNVGIGTTAPSQPLGVHRDDANTNSVQDVARFFHTTTGTPADGIGGRISIGAENDAGSLAVGSLQYLLTDVSSGSIDGRFDFLVHEANGIVTPMSIAGSNVGIGTTAPTATLHTKGSLSTALTGTVATTNTSATLTGTTTAFNTELAVNDAIKIGSEIFTVSAIASATSLTLDSASTVTASGVTAYKDPDLFAVYTGDGVAKFVVDKTGNYGIGTSAPQSILDIQGEAGSPGILTLATKELTVVDGDKLGQINFNAPLESDGSDAILVGASIWAEADDTFSTTVNSTELVFATGTSETAAEKVRIDRDGKVGIGNAIPHEMLHIGGTYGNPGLDPYVAGENYLLINSDGNTDAGVKLRDTDSQYGFTLLYDAPSHFRILRHSTSGPGESIFQIGRDTKNVGIGSQDATEKLEIEDGDATTIVQISNTATDGDPALAFALSGTKTFTMGVDDGDSDKFKIGTTAIGTNTRMTIDSSGNVGIGTTAAVSTSPFNVSADNTVLANFDHTNTGNVNTELQGRFSDDGGTMHTAWHIQFEKGGTWTSTASTRDTGFNLQLTQNGTLQNIISAKGDTTNVAIGGAPTSGDKLFVYGPLTTNNTITTDSASQANMAVDSGGSNDARYLFRNDGTNKGAILWDQSDDAIAFGLGDFNEYMRIDTSGDVGIGTTAPLKLLDVAGSAQIKGTATSVLTGTIDPAASTTVTGVSTLFTTELVVGDRITVTGETRTVTAIASATSLTVDTAFSDNANDTSPDKLAAELIVKDSSNNIDLIVTDNGDVGIGTTTPGAYKLYVNGDTYLGGLTVSNGNLTFGGALDMGNNLITNIGHADTDFTTGGGLNVTGNVGIGTTVPTQLLELVGTTPTLKIDNPNDTTPASVILNDSADRQLIIESPDGGGNPAEIYTLGTGAGVILGTRDHRTAFRVTGASGYANVNTATAIEISQFTVQNEGQTTSQIGLLSQLNTALTAGEVIGGIDFFSDDDNVSGNGDRTSSIQSLATEAHGATSLGSALTFSTTDNGTNTVDERMRIDHDGNVAIGHTAVLAGPTTPHLGVYGTSTDTGSQNMGLFSNSAAGPRMTFIHSRSGTIGTSTILQDNDIVGNITFSAADGGDLNTHIASIVAEVDDAAPAANDIGGALTFSTASGAGADDIAERMRITAAGDVGIGTTVPAYLLHGYGTSNPVFGVKDDEGAIAYMQAIDSTEVQIGTLSNDTITLYTGGAKMTILNSGKVGIGTTAPGNRLHVALATTGEGDVISIGNATAGRYGYIGFQEIGATDYMYLGGPTGTEDLVIDTNGKVGIGTTAPNALLDVEAPASTVALQAIGASGQWTGQVYANTTAGSSYGLLVKGGTNTSDAGFIIENAAGSAEYMRVRGDGNVGIGTTAPGSLDTDQVGDTGRTYLNIEDSDNIAFLSLQTGAAVADGSTLAEIHFGATGETDNHLIKASIAGLVDGSTAGQEGGELRFRTKPDATLALSDRMTILQDGNVGIGTTAPTQLLDLSAAGGGIMAITRQDATIENLEGLGSIRWSGDDSSGTGAWIDAIAGGTWATTDTPGHLRFHTTPAGSGTVVERMRIDSTGDITMGTGVVGRAGLLNIGENAAGISDTLLLSNYQASANGNGAKLAFEMNRANESGAVFAQVTGVVVDNTTASIDGKLVFSTARDNSMTDAMTIANTGNVTIGTLGTGADYYVCASAAGLLSESSSACAGSSLAYKENVADLTLGLDTVELLRPVTFDWKENYRPGEPRQVGFIAQEVEAISPLLANYRDGVIHGVNYDQLTAVLVAAVHDMLKVVDISDAPGDAPSVYVDATGNVGVGTTAPSEKLDVNSDTIRIRTAKTPSSASATCDQGEIVWDADYVYVCTATDTWKRAAIATW